MALKSSQVSTLHTNINTTEQSSEALTAVFPNPNPKAWLNGLRFGCITRELGIPPKMSSWRFGRNSSFLFSPHPTPARRAQEWRHVVPAWILSPNAYFGLQACFARKQTMLAGYEDSMLCSHVRPACGRTLSRPPAMWARTSFLYLVNFYQI